MATRIQLRRGTTAEWAAANPVLAAGEAGVNSDTHELRTGDGTTPWLSLPGQPFIKAATLALPNPAYFAHRGGGGVAPEETMEAFRTAVANGADALEMDCQPLGDGALGLMHDATVDRTTDGTGPVSGYTAPSWRALNAAAKFPWNGRAMPPALLSEVLAEFGGKVPLNIEPKNASNADQIMDLCEQAGARGSVILAASEATVLAAAQARGFPVYYWWGPVPGVGVSVADAIAGGADYLGLDGVNATDADVTALVNTGLPVMPYTINRRSVRDRLRDLGCAGFLTDQPGYLQATTAMRTVDSWRQGVFGHGLLSSDTSNNHTVVGGVLRVDTQDFCTLTVGELSPLANAAASYTLDIDLGFRLLPASGGSVTLLLGLPTDKKAPLVTAPTYPSGYLVLLRAAGGLSLYRMTDGTTAVTQLGATVTTPALTAGGFAHLTVAVTPTQITVTRTDGTPATIGPINDATYRGGYVAVGRKDVYDGASHYKNLAVT